MRSVVDETGDAEAFGALGPADTAAPSQPAAGIALVLADDVRQRRRLTLVLEPIDAPEADIPGTPIGEFEIVPGVEVEARDLAPADIGDGVVVDELDAFQELRFHDVSRVQEGRLH